MATIFKTIVRGFKNTKNTLRPPKNFIGSFMNNMAEMEPQEEKPAKKSFFNEPLAGNLNNFMKTNEDFQSQNQTEPAEPESTKTNKSFQNTCSVPFMVLIYIFFSI